MSLIQRLVSRFGSTQAQALTGAIRIGGTSYDVEWTHYRVLNSVYRNPTGRRVIERNAYEFMRPDWTITDPKAKNKIKGVDDPFLGVLNEPMPRFTGTTAQYHIRRDLDINGGTFWLKMFGQDLFGDGGPVTGLKRLPPHRVTVLSDEDDDLIGFIYIDRNGLRAPILPEEMVYVNLPDGDRQWDRAAPGVVAGLPADIDNSAMRFNAELIENDGGLPGYLVVEGLTPQVFQSWVASWRSEEQPGRTRALSSSGNGGKGNATYVRVGVSNQEMMYDKLREFAQDDICRGLGYPAVLLNPDGTTFANMDIARRTWVIGDVFPLWVWVGDSFTVQLRDQLTSPNLQIGFDLSMIDELTENLDSIVTRGVQLVAAKAMTINELRDELGLPPVAWGNDFPSAPEVLANDTTGGPESDPSGDPMDPNNTDNPPEKSRIIIDTKGTVVDTKSTNDAYLGMFHKAVDNHEDQMYLACQAFMTNQADAIYSRMMSKVGKSYAKATSDWWDGTKWNTALAQVIKTGLTGAAGASGDLVMSTLESTKAFDATSPRMTEYLDNRSVEVSGLVNNTTETEVRSVIAGLTAQGESIPNIAAAVKQYFTDEKAMRSRRVARTEVVGASNYAALEAAKQSGIVTGKTWTAASTADEECQMLDGTTVPLEGVFADGLEQPPAHVNCRCALLFETE